MRGVRAGGVTSDWVQVGPYTCSVTAQTLDASDVTGMLSPATLPAATSSSMGAVQPDGTTITVSGGVLSAVASLTAPVTIVTGSRSTKGLIVQGSSGFVVPALVQSFGPGNSVASATGTMNTSCPLKKRD